MFIQYNTIMAGSCEGWYVNPRTQYDNGPVNAQTDLYYSFGKGVSIHPQVLHRYSNALD